MAFKFLSSGIDITPESTETWTTVSAADYVPVGDQSTTSGIIVKIEHTNAGIDGSIGLRKQAGQHSRVDIVYPDSLSFGFSGVQDNPTLDFQVYVSTSISVWLIGYTLNATIFPDTQYDVTPETLNAWTNIDLSSQLGSNDAAAAIFELVSETTDSFGFRPIEALGDYHAEYLALHTWVIVKLDDRKRCEAYLTSEHTEVHFIGYIQPDWVSMYPTQNDVGVLLTSTWLDLGPSMTFPANSTGAIIEVVSPTLAYDYGLRQNDATDSASIITRLAQRHLWGTVEVDSSQSAEGYRSNADLKFYLHGVALAEQVKNVFVSVCPDADDGDPRDLKTGWPTISIDALGTATINVKQTNNIGVGTCINYGVDEDKCFISEVISNDTETVVQVTTILGDIPSEVTEATVNSIYHPFLSLYSAENDLQGAGWFGTDDLTDLNIRLNVACYTDTTDHTPDTHGLIWRGWRTDPSRNLRIFTPSGESECIQDVNRHSGYWNSSIYYLDSYLYMYVPYCTIDGLQIYRATSRVMYLNNLWFTFGEIVLSNCILKRGTSSSNYPVVDLQQAYSTTYVRIFNNIICGAVGGRGIEIDDADYIAWIENNTIADCTIGIRQTNGTVVATNNIVRIPDPSTYKTFEGDFSADSGYNLTNDSEAPGSNNIEDADLDDIFRDTASGDYRLDEGDTTAVDQATQDTITYFLTDIAGTTRGVYTTMWDIGAFEIPESSSSSSSSSHSSSSSSSSYFFANLIDDLILEWGPSCSSSSSSSNSSISSSSSSKSSSSSSSSSSSASLSSSSSSSSSLSSSSSSSSSLSSSSSSSSSSSISSVSSSSSSSLSSSSSSLSSSSQSSSSSYSSSSSISSSSSSSSSSSLSSSSSSLSSSSSSSSSLSSSSSSHSSSSSSSSSTVGWDITAPVLAINEQDTATVRISFFDEDDQPVVPDSVTYVAFDKFSGEIRSEGTVDPATLSTSIHILLTSDTNVIYNQNNRFEMCVMNIAFTYDGGKVGRIRHQYKIRNISIIT